jgi:hypothetical protein
MKGSRNYTSYKPIFQQCLQKCALVKYSRNIVDCVATFVVFEIGAEKVKDDVLLPDTAYSLSLSLSRLLG